MIQVVCRSHETRMVGISAGSPLEKLIDDATCYMAPGYERDKRYKLGKWDGKVHLLERLPDGAHTTSTGLMPRVLAVLQQEGQAYTLQNEVPVWEQDPALAYLSERDIPLRPYQQASVEALMAGPTQLPVAYRRRGGVLQGATGMGKTRVAAKVIQTAQVKTVFLVNQKDLMAQTIGEFEALLGCKVGQVGGGKCDIQDVTVCTVQTVALVGGFDDGIREKPESEERALAIRRMMSEAGLVIVDECHGVPAVTSQNAVRLANRASILVGLSASPWRDDGMDLLIEATCGPVVHTVTASDLILQGYLVKPQIFVHKMPEATEGLDRYSEEFHKFYRAWIVDDHKRNRYIAELALEHVGYGELVLVLIRRIEHGRILERMIPQSVFLDGTMAMKKRKEVVEAVRRGEVPCLIATSLADQGLDIPALSVVILAGGGKSSMKALQRIGRVLRNHEGKSRATIHDIVDSHEVFTRHFKERRKIYKTESEYEILERDVDYDVDAIEGKGLTPPTSALQFERHRHVTVPVGRF